MGSKGEKNDEICIRKKQDVGELLLSQPYPQLFAVVD